MAIDDLTICPSCNHDKRVDVKEREITRRAYYIALTLLICVLTVTAGGVSCWGLSTQNQPPTVRVNPPQMSPSERAHRICMSQCEKALAIDEQERLCFADCNASFKQAIVADQMCAPPR